MSSLPDPSADPADLTAEARASVGARRYPHAQTALTLVIILVACLYTTWLVAVRPLDTGTDTRVYAGIFEAMRAGLPETRLEFGFIYLTYALYNLGLSVTAYQGALFVALLGSVMVAVGAYHARFADACRLSTYLAASLMLLFVSPMFMQGAINAIRQGISAPLLLAAMLQFQRRKWFAFALLGFLATSFHLSSGLYLAFAPLLLFRRNTQIAVGLLAFFAYVSGLSRLLVQVALPSLYEFVMEYTANDAAFTKIGVRPDFAVFSVFWYVLAWLALPMVSQRFRDAVRDGAAIYLVLLLPFFAVGWGYYSNRYLLPGWWTASLLLAAVLCCNRMPLLRSPLTLGVGLLASCGLFAYFINNNIVV